MNNKTRKQLTKIAEKIYDLANEIDHLREELQEIADNEQEKYDNMPEQLQDTENGSRMYECIEELEDLTCRIDSSVSDLYDITNDIEHVNEI